jgi:hypothetical protein
VLLITAGVLWVIKHLRADLPATQPLIKEETGFTPSGGGLFTPTVTQSEPRRAPELNDLIPALERRYISREHPAPGKPLPDNWLKDEVSHLNVELLRRELDEIEIDTLRLPLRKEGRTIENPQELSQYQALIAVSWNRTELEFKQVTEMLRNLMGTWLSFRASSNSQVRLPGASGPVVLTPEIFSNIQDQAKAAIDRLRVHIIVLELLFSRIVLREKKE